MKRFMDEYWFIILSVFAYWVLFSFASSSFKETKGNCGKAYPIDYVLYSNLFCEIKDE